MKALTLPVLAAMALLSSCNKSKPAAEATTASSASHTTADLHSGVVTTAQAAAGCPFLVDLGAGAEPRMLIPIGLDEQYLKDGLKLTFTYRVSRASNGGCRTGQTAILEQVSVAR